MAQGLYACYLEIRSTPAGRRAQWVLMPPRPQLFDGITTGGRVEAFYWHRVQQRPDHRAVWRWTELSPALEPQLIATMRQFSGKPGWQASPLIVVPLSMRQLNDMVDDRKTPYDVLRKAASTARSKFNYEVA